MKKDLSRLAVAAVMAAGAIIAPVHAQSLTDKLEEEQSFYLNYGKEEYSKLKIEKDIVGLYDFFGKHIVDGVHIYELSNSATRLSNDVVADSVEKSESKEYQKNDFYEKFSNLVVTQDAIGGIKTSFLVGDQITTKFTPLTFNKTNFRGIRWDLWSSGLQFSFLLSRTRPGWVSKKDADGAGSAVVEYPITRETFPESYYGAGIKGNQDFSSKSPYGDYDLLWSAHAENTIANKVDVGLTYINHHVSDVKKGPNPIKGDLPDSLMPDHVHFEFYDQTAQDSLDAGVWVDDVSMFVNGDGPENEVEARPAYRGLFRRAFVGDRDDVLLPRELPLARPQNGSIPVIVEFKTDPQFWQFKQTGRSLFSLQDVKRLVFKYKVAGNYMVFVSTDRQIPLAIDGTWNPQRRAVDYFYPKKNVGDIYDAGLKIDEVGLTAVSTDRNYSTTYFGEYIAQSPRKTSLRASDFETAVAAALRSPAGMNSRDKASYNYHEFRYEYNLNVSSTTYGVNFRGELAGVKFSGEFALNQKEDMLPGGGDESRVTTNKIAGTLRAERKIGTKFGLDGEAYYISPQWMTNLEGLQVSQYFRRTRYKNRTYNVLDENTGQIEQRSDGYYDYLIYPRPLDHSWQNIDDNDDNDAFVESDRRRYPSDMDAADDKGRFTNDGQMVFGDELNKLVLPSKNNVGKRIAISYDDPDGVTASKEDKNENGDPDYREDFLLFESDLPVFELGIDQNNNGLRDDYDDDILPDFGHKVGYVITGDGIRTQGIRGFSLNLRFTPIANTFLDFGGIMESVNDYDLALEEDEVDFDNTTGEGKSKVIYLTATRQVLKRSQGLQYDLGAEIRGIKDALRNDAVETHTYREGDQINADYSYYIDPLAYRSAVVGQLLGTVTYTNIRNFEYIAKVMGGVEKHFGNPDEMVYYPGGYDTKWRFSEDRIVTDAHAVAKMMYTIKFDKEYDDWRSMFNFINRLEIIPQYKLAFHMRGQVSGPDRTLWGNRDSSFVRDIAKSNGYDLDKDGEIDDVLDDFGSNLDSVEVARQRWNEYKRDNSAFVLNVPILKLSYKIAENTALQLGGQWKRYQDIVSPEDNRAELTLLGQVVSRAQYKGYSVTFFVGARWKNSAWDVNARDAVLDLGSNYNIQEYTFFAKLYSGI